MYPNRKVRIGFLIPAIVLTFLFLLILLGLIMNFELTVLIFALLTMAVPAVIFWLLAFRIWIFGAGSAGYVPPAASAPIRPQAAAPVPAPAKSADLPLDIPGGTQSPAAAAPQNYGPLPENKKDPAYRFAADPAYREKVIAKVHKKADAEYNRAVKEAQAGVTAAQYNRQKELQRLADARWVKAGKISINQEEGLVRINGSPVPFSSIRGAALNCVYGARYIQKQKGSAQSRKHGSLGGGLMGNMVAGPMGGVIGGAALGRTTTHSTRVTTSSSIPTCDHLGVNVDVDGFVSEILIMTGTIEQSDRKFQKLMQEAQTLIGNLRAIAKTPMPEYIKPLEEYPSVLQLDGQIANAQARLQQTIAARPTYAIPPEYLPPAAPQTSQVPQASQAPQTSQVPQTPPASPEAHPAGEA